MTGTSNSKKESSSPSLPQAKKEKIHIQSSTAPVNTKTPAKRETQKPVSQTQGLFYWLGGGIAAIIISTIGILLTSYLQYINIESQLNQIESNQQILQAEIKLISDKLTDLNQPNLQQADAPAPLADSVTSIDDDAVAGNRNASVAIVEFSDFNCPFCKQYHQTTYSQIKQNFVETGKIAYVHRDYAGVGGEETARSQVIAECVRDQFGDSEYFSFIESLYAEQGQITQSLALQKAEQLEGLDSAELTACSEDESNLEEVYSDLQAGVSAGINGTPSFIVGTLSSDGTVKGELVVGSRPYPDFEIIIEKYLNE